MEKAEIDAFLAAERLPAAFRLTLERVCGPLAERAAALRQARGATTVLGLCGAQGSGKSTIAAAAVKLLEAQGLAAIGISLDDFYLSGAARQELARRVHPLFVTRGPPGTHDVALACATLDGLQGPGATALPSFDKAADEPRPRSDWRTLSGPLDVVVFEGWCVGTRPQPARALAAPVNALEAEEDAQGVWRTHVNEALAGAYQALFGRLHALVFLAAPSFEVVAGWRAEQEAKLRARTGGGMDERQIARFVAHYERLTRWMMTEMPARADLTVRLDAERMPL